MDKYLLSENIIRLNIEKCEHTYGYDDNYHRPLQKMYEIRLGNITELDVKDIIEDYLYV